ncbi:MAG: phosphate ABC transporter permease PstA [Pseudomonadota bacterium]|nr:phosphate ABC transporter permease PstA [Pseudomonadota bacterium]
MTLRERIGFTTLALATFSLVLLVFALLVYIVAGGTSVLSWEFLSQAPRVGMTEGGIFPALLGTFLLTIITAASSVPLGIAAAIYLVEYAREGTFIRLIRLSIRNLSGVPSVVFGLFGVGLFVHGLSLGHSILASGLTLGLLTLPTTITAAEEALKSVPRSYRDGALALGATRWEAVQTNVLPAAAPGILTGVILGLSRAAGETAPILFTGVAFSLPDLPTSLGDQFMALPYHLYILSTQHHDIVRVRPIAFATATVLIGLVALLNLSATYLRARARARMHS